MKIAKIFSEGVDKSVLKVGVKRALQRVQEKAEL